MNLDEALEIANGRDPRREKSWKEMVEIIRDSDGEEVRVTTVEDTYTGTLTVDTANPLDALSNPGLLQVHLENDEFDWHHEITSLVKHDTNNNHPEDQYFKRLSVFKTLWNEDERETEEELERIIDIERA